MCEKASTFTEENDRLLNSLFERTYYRSWRDKTGQTLGNFNGFEIIMTYTCNLGCAYCYVNRYGDSLYPFSRETTDEVILNNLSIMLDWLIENDFYPRVELFSGEPLIQRVGYKCIDMMLDKLKGRGQIIIIPTNFTFLLSDHLTAEVERLVAKSFENECPIVLSASFDGKLMEKNRPFRHNHIGLEFDHRIAEWIPRDPQIPDPRDDAYYDKCFALAKKWNFGFHPMIYSHNVHLWKDNFLWFQSMFKKYDIPWHSLYLLEVRNPEWTSTQIKEFGKFVEFLIYWSFDMCGRDVNAYMDFIFEGKGFNILNSVMSTVGRGLGCGYQSHIYARLADMKLVSCHRTSYDPFVIGEYNIRDNKIIGVKAHNVEHMIGGVSADAKTFPYCEQCMIKHLCTQGCLGAQIETTGDAFTPFPTMCAMEHEKVWAMLRAYNKLNITESFYTRISSEKAVASKYMNDILIGELN